jgi:ATP-dependent exoDNAse (exonuclease V) alpha subunit
LYQNSKGALNDDEDSSCAALPAAIYCRMAIYHSHMSYTSRSGGGSACSHAAYISGSIVKDERTGQTWDYSKKAHDVLYSEILAPENSPNLVYDCDQLWNEVEKFEDYIAEKRFKGHKDSEKNAKSLAGKEKFLSSCKTSFKADFALPIEITDKNHLRELARKIVKECYVGHGLVAQYAIHDMKGNPHLHIIAITRPLIEGSFSERRFVIEREQLVEMRKQMADICNQYAQEKGYNYHLDHRSYKDQGIKLVATKHLGPNARHRLQEISQNVQDNEEIRQKNIEILFEHPEEIIKVVASQKAVFTQVDLYREIFKRVGGDDKLYEILKAKVDGVSIPYIAIIGKTLNDNSIYESKSIQFKKEDYVRTIDSFTAKILSEEHAIYLGENIKGQAFYTSHEMKQLETSIAETVDSLMQKNVSQIAEKYKLTAIEKIQKEQEIIFTEEQRGAIDHLLSNTAINVLTGKAGTGKSTVLMPVVEAYKQSGFTVIGTSFQGKVADQLSNELEIEGYTLDQLNNRWNAQDKLKTIIENKELKGQALVKAKAEVERLQEWRLTDKHVVILDEGSMVHGSLWKSLLQEVDRSGAQLQIVQDNKQIKALYGLDAARLIEEKVGAYVIKNVVRQKEHWMREASAHLNEHRIEDGLKPYYERGHFDFRERDFETKISLVADYLEGIAQAPHQTHMILAQKNKDVVELNELLREALMSQGKLGDEFIFGREGEGILNPQQSILKPKTQHVRKSAYGRRFAVGDRVMFLENDHKERYVTTLEKGKNDRVGVKNGTLGVIESFDLQRQTVVVRLHDGRLVGFDSKSYDSLTHGYAVTINKSQGATYDHSYSFFSSFNSNQLLIWLTRHKESFKGYVSKGIASDLKGMVSHVARSDYKGLSTDYDLTDHQKSYFNLVQHYWEISRDAGNLRTKIEALTLQADETGKELSLSKEWGHYNELVQTRNKNAKEILKNWSQCSPFMHQTGVRRETLEVQAGLRKRLLSAVEEAALDKVETYFNISHQARNLWKEISKSHPGSLSHHHPEYETYANIKDVRNKLAYEIASFPMLYKPFFKVSEQNGTYVTHGGSIHEKRPQGFKSVHVQAEQYINQRKTQAFENMLKFEERTHYKQVLEYKSLHHQSAVLSQYLKEIRSTAVLSEILESNQLKNEEIVTQRDTLAYKIVSNYSNTQPFIEKLNIKSETLLKHAVFGEVRELIGSYRETQDIKERTQIADKLVSFTLKDTALDSKPFL